MEEIENNKREARNITYKDFLTSEFSEIKNVVSQKSEIPEFQRNYVWKKSQIKDLIESIKENNDWHYFWNIVLVKESTNGIWKIVDWQQRLITLSLIAFVLLDYIIDKDLKLDIEMQIWTNSKKTKKHIEFKKDKLEEIYSNILNNKPIDLLGINKSQEILYKSYEEIRKIIQSDIINKEDFWKKLLKIEFVVIRTFTENEAYLLFEWLNSTWLSLSSVELTKNAILWKIKELDPWKVEDALTKWNSIELGFENSNLSWFLKMLRSQWFYIDWYVTNPDLFKRIKTIKIQKSNIKNLLEYLDEIEKDSIKYLKLRITEKLNKQDFNIAMNKDSWNKIYEILFQTSKLNLDQVYSLYLGLWKYWTDVEKKYIDDWRKFANHIEKIWSFIFLIKFSDVSPSKYEKLFANLVSEIRGRTYEKFKTKLDIFFKEKLFKLASWINKDEFANRVANDLSTVTFDPSFVKFVLKDYLGNGLINETTIEHIIPQNWHSLRPNINSSLNLSYIENIGNLTLLSEENNKDAEDKSFEDKSEIYNKSGFDKNKKLSEDFWDGFKSVNPIDNAVIIRWKSIGEGLYDKYLNNLINN